MNYRYKTTFTAKATVITPSEQDRFVAKASLLPLKGLIPVDVNPEEDPDLLYFSCNGAVGGLVNKNGDGVSNETALAIYKSSKNKYVTTDHDRATACGVVLFPGLSRFGTNEVISDEVAASLKEPFNMSFAGVLWRAINPMVANYITATDNGTDQLSMSWEIAFDSYSLAVGSRNLFDAKIVKPDDPAFGAYDKMLRANGGEGRDPSGQEVSRIIGNDAIILGYSLVPNPAAEVKGVLPVQTAADEVAAPISFSKLTEEQCAFLAKEAESGMGFHMCDITMKDGALHEKVPVLSGGFFPLKVDVSQVLLVTLSQKSEEKIITSSNASVTINTAKIMKIESITQLEAALGKFESAAAVMDFVKAIQDGSVEYVTKLEAKENLIKTTEAARLENENRAKELATSLAEVQKQLEQVRAAALAAEAQQKHSERMAAFDEEFELDDEDRKFIGSDIKDLDDAAFATYKGKCDKLMAAKKKKKGAAVPQDNQPMDQTNKCGASEIKAALASTQPNADDKSAPPHSVVVPKTLADEFAEAFGGSLKINGKAAIEQVSK